MFKKLKWLRKTLNLERKRDDGDICSEEQNTRCDRYLGVGSYFDPKLKLKGIKLNISNWRRPAPNTIPWDTKAAGLYMICTLSKHEAEAQGYTDSLMLDHEGNVAEATGANVFFKDKSNNLLTPTPDLFRWNYKERSY